MTVAKALSEQKKSKEVFVHEQLKTKSICYLNYSIHEL